MLNEVQGVSVHHVFGGWKGAYMLCRLQCEFVRGHRLPPNRDDEGQRRLECETAAQCAVTECVHWGRTEHRLHALRYMNESLTKALHHHTQWEGYRSIAPESVTGIKSPRFTGAL
ncbi:uncharacterized protein V6R79_013456 [Siganus canaliculatus]